MKIKRQEVTETEVEVSLPCYRRNGAWLALIISENELIQVTSEGSHFHHYNGTMGFLWTGDFFKDESREATREEFENALSAAYEIMRSDIQKYVGRGSQVCSENIRG